MIKVDKITDYAIHLLVAFARLERNRNLNVAELTNLTGLPKPTVAKITKLLAKEDVLTSTRGTHGGYHLHRNPKELTIRSLVEIFQGPIALTTCLSNEKEKCMVHSFCQARHHWDKVNIAIKNALESVTLFDML